MLDSGACMLDVTFEFRSLGKKMKLKLSPKTSINTHRPMLADKLHYEIEQVPLKAYLVVYKKKEPLCISQPLYEQGLTG